MPDHAAPMRVVIADDDSRIRTALADLLAHDDEFELVGAAGDGVTALQLVRELEAALVLVDVRMPYGGPPLVAALTGLPHRPVVVGMSGHRGTASWTGMLAAGASGYLLKGAVAADLPSLLRRCASGELVVAVPGAADVVRRLLLKPR